MEKVINISFVADRNYFKHMFVAIESVIRNTSTMNSLKFLILDVGIGEENKETLVNRYSNCSNVSIGFIKVDIDKVSNFKIKTHVSKAAYAKVYICDLLKEDKVIYLDCDLVVNEDISILWDTFDDQVILKAVWNPFYNYDNKYFGLDENSKTFNSGVMLLNLDLMRKNSSSKKLVEFLYENHDKTRLHDQAAFNGVFKNEWVELDIKWNTQVSMFQNTYKNLCIKKNELLNLYERPNVIHFTSNSKPWQFRNSHPYKNLYKKYYEDIFGNLQYQEVTIKSLLQKIKEYTKYKYYYYINMI